MNYICRELRDTLCAERDLEGGGIKSVHRVTLCSCVTLLGDFMDIPAHNIAAVFVWSWGGYRWWWRGHHQLCKWNFAAQVFRIELSLASLPLPSFSPLSPPSLPPSPLPPPPSHFPILILIPHFSFTDVFAGCGVSWRRFKRSRATPAPQCGSLSGSELGVE